MNAPAYFMRIATTLTLLFFAAAISAADASKYSAQQWLERMVEATSDVNYQGVMIYGNQELWETLKVTHALIDGQKYEKMLYLTGEPREFIRQGNQLTCIHPDSSVTKLTKQTAQNPLSKNLSQNLQQLAEVYDAYIESQERVAGRMAQKISLKPKDAYRYAYEFWLDNDSALLLRSDMLDQSKVLERFQFSQVKIGLSLPKAMFKPETQGRLLEAEIVEPAKALETQIRNFQPTWTPSGFKLSKSKIQSDYRESRGKKLMYSDGLNYFSVFVEPSVQSLPEVNNKWGATSAIVVYKLHENKVYKVTVVGELPIEAIKKVAKSVSFAQSE